MNIYEDEYMFVSIAQKDDARACPDLGEKEKAIASSYWRRLRVKRWVVPASLLGEWR